MAWRNVRPRRGNVEGGCIAASGAAAATPSSGIATSVITSSQDSNNPVGETVVAERVGNSV